MQHIGNEVARPELEGPGVPQPFDPFRLLLQPHEATPAPLKPHDWRTLTPWQRALLRLDGMVTTFLEASALEPIDTVPLYQAKQVVQTDHAWLEVPKGTTVITRQSFLRGRDSATVYAYAVSVLVPERLPPEVQRGLPDDALGLGRLLSRSQREHRREVLWYGHEHLAELPVALQQWTGQDFLSRTYRIIADGKPIMLINEKFPYKNPQSIAV